MEPWLLTQGSWSLGFPESLCQRNGDPGEIRTRVAAVKGRCPRPLDDGARYAMQFIFTRNPHLKPRYVCGFSKGRRTNTLKTFCSGQATYAHLRALAGVVGLEPTIVRLTVECCTNSAIPQYIQGSLKCINQLCYLSQVDGMGLEPIILLKKICCMSLLFFFFIV